MTKMRASFFETHGGTDRLRYDYVERPEPGKREVLVRVKACALNHLDLWALMGMPGVKMPLPHILGCDIAGEVVEVGPKVTGIPRNRPVIVSPGLVDRHSPWADGRWDSLAPGYRIVGFQVDGGYAEYVKVPARNIIPVSKRLSYEEWAAVPLTFLTAWHMLVTRAQLKKKEKVLIHAAGSGVGSAGIQIAKYLGAKVFTTVGSDRKIRLAKEIGADYVIPYHKKDFAQEIRRLTRNEGVDVVFEHIGPATFAKSLESLAKKGRCVTCGITSGPVAELNLRYIFFNQLSVLGCYMGGIRELREVVRLIEKGKLRPVIDKVFPLRQAGEALQRMQNRENFGKIILTP